MLKNKVIIITGASSGIGEATAYKLASQGANLVLAARREDRLKKIVEKIKTIGSDAIYHVTDVVKREDNQDLVNLALTTYGKIDAIFLNAGLMPQAPMSALEQDNWDRIIDVNIKGVTNGIAAVLPQFIKQDSGHIITTSSVAGLKVYPGSAVYSGSKWAVKAIMEGLRMEIAQDNRHIKVSTIYPGAVASELVDSITNEETKAGYRQYYDAYEIPSERVADVVLFALQQPEDTNISEFTIGPVSQPW